MLNLPNCTLLERYAYVNELVRKSNKVEVVERLIDFLRGWTIEAHSSSVSSRLKAVALESLERHHLGDVHHRWPTQYHETYEERVLCEIMSEATYRRLLSLRSYVMIIGITLTSPINALESTKTQ